MKLILSLFSLFFLFSCYSQLSNYSELCIEMRMDFDNAIFTDIDQDGDDDILGVSANRVYFLENDGLGNFGEDSILFETIENLVSINAFDINSDGMVDLVVSWKNITSHTSGIEIWRKTSGLTFVLETTLFADVFAKWSNRIIVYEDLNNDNLPDLVLSGESEISFFQHVADFNFTLNTSFNGAQAAVIGDVNLDGWNDIVYSYGHEFRIAFNDGSGSFLNISQPYGPSSTAFNNSSDIELIDADNDGDLDVVQLLDGENDILLFANDGSGIYSLNSTLYNTFSPNYISNLIKHDFNNDGISDIAWKLRNTNTSNIGGAGIIKGMLGDGNSFTSLFNLNQTILGTSPMNFSDNIGNNEDNLLLYGGVDSNFKRIIICKETAPGIYNHETYFREKYYSNFTNFIPIDVDNNGFVDLIKPPFFYKNFGNNNFDVSFDSTFVGTLGVTYKCFSHADLNNDGHQDLIGVKQTSSNKYIGYWLGGTGFNFSSFNVVATENGSSIGKIDVHDINSDGLIDIFYTRHSSSNYPEIHYVINQGLSGFSSEYEWLSNWGFNNLPNIPYMDYTFGANSSETDNIDLAFIVNSNISVVTNGNIIPQNIGIQATTLFIDDVDQDGLLDILYILNTQGIGWVKNEGNQVFTDQGIIYPVSFIPIIVYKDIDNDNDKDILLLNGPQLILIESTGYGNFSNPITLSNEGLASYQFLQYTYAEDFDNDGDIDILHPKKPHAIYQPQLDVNLYRISNFLQGNYQISGFVFNDENINQVIDSSESKLESIAINLNANTTDYSNQNGEFLFGADQGANNISINIPQFWSLTSSQTSINLLLSPTNQIEDSLFLGLHADTTVYSCESQLIGSFPRCNTIGNYWISLHNIGTVNTSGIIELILDDSLTFINSQITTDSIIGNSYFWHYDEVNPLTFSTFNVAVQFPNYLSAGHVVTSVLINHDFDSTGVIINTTSDTLNQTIVCGYDPNDKSVEPKGIDSLGFVTNDKVMEYLVRFQNTGNDTVFNVKIVDQLHENLDPSTLEILSYSHPLNYQIQPTGKLIFNLNNILLPDSSINFLGSQGFIKYKVAMKPNLAAGKKIKNHANIYFDQNPPVVTNTTLNTIFSCNDQVIFDNIPSIACSGDTILFTPDVSLLDSNQWYLNNILQSLNNTFSFVSSYPSDTITFIGANNFCQYDSSIIIESQEIYLDLGLPSNVGLCEGDSLILVSNYSTENTWYLDNNIVGFDSTYTVTESGQYQLVSNYGACYAEDSISIEYHSIPTPEISNNDSIFICQGSTLTLTSNYASGNTWYADGSIISTDSMIVISQTGNYFVETTNQFCVDSGSDSVFVMVTPSPLAEYEFVNFTTIQSVNTYEYYFWLDCNNGYAYITGENSSIFSPSSNGSFALKVYDEYGCFDISDCFTINFSNIEEYTNEIYIAPNPATNKFSIYGLTEDTDISITDACGREVLITSSLQIIDLTNLNNGSYFVKFELHGRPITKQLIIAK